ncbi:sensor histidine kinase [Halorarius litoreus]|uniref:sensor histidine kinase n=1 Tax=Halorarius litoreus TaxID=2962676 RepID=UPI0020CC8AEC|nr:GAF domain-containing sensor histidine kinase [Halorarius litoreus]
MTDLRVRVSGSDDLRARVAALDGVTVVDDDPDCCVTDDPAADAGSLPTVAVADDPTAVHGGLAGFVRPDAPDTHLLDQLRLAVSRASPSRSKAERLHDITRDIVACDDPETVYRLATEAAARILDFDISYVAEAGETYFEPKAMSETMGEDGYTDTMRIDEGLAGRTYQRGESILVDDLAAVDEAKPVDPDYRAALSVPIGDIGIFQAASTRPGTFDERDRELVELLMSHVAETITRLRTEARLREERRTIEQLHESTTELLACQEETALCERIVTAAERVLEFEVCSVLLVNHETGRLEIVATSDSPLAPPVGNTIRPDEGIAGRTFQEETTILVDEVENYPEAKPSDEAFESALSLPLGSVGVVQAIAAEPRAFDDRDRELAELFVSQAAAVFARLRAEQELVTERDRLEQFASVLSHDLRNPLSVAKGHLDLTLESGDEQHLERVDDALDRMDALVDDVLTLAREPSLDERPDLDLETHAEEAARNVGLDALRVADGLPTVGADPSALLRLLENLFRNAMEHGDDDVTVRVEPLTDGDATVGFAVADDGPGIPETAREQVFESGYTTGGGTGLGLPIVRSIAESHGWSVTVDDSEAGGAQFEIRTT